ncbi:hypothetical protein [Gilvimarinus algae]|uniref:NADH dehydrogenase subunit 6 n=1 Tax=Gilvimarinus algae TaxID=3058037 RepID=A0ABT8TG15_9GAMM|nr:hypothetical protein [Gilvimarinus sp. SDUM040014]MDO3383014.1 hypothetical protein [Gilvimarinus sp. SDUM040014]
MKEYFKIVASIVISLLALSTCFSILIGASEWYGGRDYEAMIFPYIVAIVGLIFFGVLGSAFWFSFLVLISGIKSYSFRGHVVSACLSTIVTVFLVSFLASGADFSQFLVGLYFYIVVIPVVASSLLVLWFLYFRGRR